MLVLGASLAVDRLPMSSQIFFGHGDSGDSGAFSLPLQQCATPRDYYCDEVERIRKASLTILPVLAFQLMS